MMESTIKHEDPGHLLAQYFDGVLPENEKDEFEAHYPDCPICEEAIHRAIGERMMVDRYTLHKLLPGEQEFFEGHYFACRICTEAVKEAEYLIPGLRHAAGEGRLSPVPLQTPRHDPLKEFWARFKPAIFSPAIAFGVLALLLLYPAWRGLVTLPRLERSLMALQQPKANSRIFALEHTRQGEKQLVEIPTPGAPSSVIILQLPPLDKISADSRFRAQIIDAGNDQTIWEEQDLRSTGDYAIFAITCPSSFFTPGRFLVKVDEVDRDNAQILQTNDFVFEVVFTP